MPAAPPAQQGQGTPAKMPQSAPWPFPVGVLDTQNASDYDNTKTMSTGTVQFPDVQVQPDGWTRGIWFDVNGVATSNTNTVTFNGDAAAGSGAPFTAINTVLFRDTGGEQIFGPFNGYDWMTTNKFGGYHEVGDPRGDYNYSTTTGSATNSGNFHFTLYLPIEISAADALGDVENRSENSIYRVSLTLEQSSVVYGQAPLNLPAVEIKTTQDSYTEPVAAMALSGRQVSQAPPSPGTLQYWKQEDDSGIVNGAHSTYITNGIGNGYRNILFKLIRTSGTRANGTSDWPDPQELDLGTTRIRYLYKKTWQDKIIREYGFTGGGSADIALGLENGVFPLWFDHDTGQQPGNESRRKYLRTKPGNTLKLRGTYSNAGTLYITSNYIVPRNNDFSQIVR